MEGAAAHAGQYPGIARGNFRFKASLESSNNLVHNTFGALPGQTGKDRNHCPEQMNDSGPKFDKDRNLIGEGGLKWENENLLAARNYLSPERAALLQFPILELNQFMQVATELYAAIENDPDHDLEGWIESGHVTQEILLGGQWIDQKALTQNVGQAELALELIRAGALQTRPRKLTRAEVWRAGAVELVRIPGHGVCAI